MRVLWATCGLAVAASALTGVLIGVYLDGVNDEQQADTPASTWITGRSSTSSSSTTPPSTVTTDAVSSPAGSTTTVRPTTTTTTTAPPPPPETTAPPPPPPPATTTTKVRNTDWPCSPINPLPPPSCDD